MNFTQVYTSEKTRLIKKKARLGLAGFAASALLFAAICAAFCVLTAFDLVNAYLGCALCTVITVLFLWYGYLFFAVYFASALKKYKFVKYLDNAKPLYSGGVYNQKYDEENGYVKLGFGETEYLWDGEVPFTAGKEYEVAVVKDIIVAFREAQHE